MGMSLIMVLGLVFVALQGNVISTMAWGLFTIAWLSFYLWHLLKDTKKDIDQ